MTCVVLPSKPHELEPFDPSIQRLSSGIDPEARQTSPLTHWLYPDHPAFWTKSSTCPSQRFLDTLAACISRDIYNVIANPSASLYSKVRSFIYFICGKCPIARGQLLLVVTLIRRLIQHEKITVDIIQKQLREKQSLPETAPVAIPKSLFQPVVTEENIGTVLLCAFAISGKVNEDIPYNNRFWSNLVHIDLSILNSSERVFLQRIHYDVNFHAEDILKLAESLNIN